jgi:adenylyl-sulfate kinase
MTDHIYAHDHPESTTSRGGGFTLWFTGLSGSGKSTIAHIVGPELERRGRIVEYLDGDTVRTHLTKGLGFSKEDRDTNIERIGWVASRITRHGGAAIVAAISPYAETRAKARQMIEEFGPMVEVFVGASVEECTRRDTKGLYEKALRGEIKEFTGVSDPYEQPEQPELLELVDDGLGALLRRNALGVDDQLRARGRLVGIGHAGELLDLAGESLLVEALDVTLGAGLD